METKKDINVYYATKISASAFNSVINRFEFLPIRFTEPRSSAGLLCFLGVGAPFVPLNNAYYLDIYLCCNSFTCIPAEPVKLMDQQVIYCSMMIRAKRNRKYSYFSYLSFNEPVRQQHVSNS